MKIEQKVLLVLTGSVLLPFYISGVVCAVVGLIVIWRMRSEVWRGMQSCKELLYWWLLSLGVSIYYHNVGGMWMGVAFLFIIALFMGYTRLMTSALYQKILEILVCGSLFVNGKAIYDYWRYVRVEKLPLEYILLDASPTFRAESTFFNPNYLGLFCVFVVLMAYYVGVTRQHYRWRVVSVVASLLALVAMVLTASRMIYPALLVSLLVAVCVFQPRMAKVLLAIGGALGGLLLLHPSVLPRLTSSMLGVRQRLDIWQTSWYIFVRSPLVGRGAFSYFKYYYLFDGPALPHAHNLLLDTLDNYGMLGVWLLVAASVQPVRDVCHAFKYLQHRHELGLVLSVVVAVLVHGIVDVAIIWLQTGVIAGLVVVGGVQLLKQEK